MSDLPKEAVLAAWEQGIQGFTHAGYNGAIRTMASDELAHFSDNTVGEVSIRACAEIANDLPSIKRRHKSAACDDAGSALLQGYMVARYILGTFDLRPSYSAPADIETNARLIAQRIANISFDDVLTRLTEEADQELRGFSEYAGPRISVTKDLGQQGAVAFVFTCLVTGIQLALAEATLFLPPASAGGPG